MVTCKVCGGEGRLPYQEPGGCLCCAGAGQITKQRADALAQISRDIAKRLAEKGWF